MPVAALTAAYRSRFGGPPYPLLPAGESSPVTFPSSPLRARIMVALGADLSADWHTWNWLDITDRIRVDQGVAIQAGRADQYAIAGPSRAWLKVDNNDGYLTRRNPTSPFYGLLTKNTPIWVQVNPGSGFADRYQGFVNEWPAKWADLSGTDTVVMIECSGALRRLAQTGPLKSALYRSTAGVAAGDYVPLAYWPMEDGAGATQIASAIPGVAAATFSGSITFASHADLSGSDLLPSVDAGAVIQFPVPAYTNTNQWVVQLLVKVSASPGVDTTLMEIDTPGSQNVRWRLYLESNGSGTDFLWFLGYDSTGAQTGSGSGIEISDFGPTNDVTPAQFYDHWYFLSLTNYVSGGAAFGDLNYTNDGLDISGSDGSSGAGMTLVNAVSAMRIFGAGGVAFGHVALFTDTAFDITADVLNNASAMLGYTGELAHVRMARLCREERVPFHCLANTSAALGPQSSGALLDVLREAETADQGILFEYQFGLGYLALSERYNQAVSMALDFHAGQISGLPEPSDDDQFTRNQITASRTGGSSATAEQTTGTMRTGAGGPGVWAEQVTANVELDSQLLDYASWRVHMGTVDEDRWPRLPLLLHGSPELIPSWLAMPYGGRITVSNPPAEMAPDAIDVVMEGYDELFDEVAWFVAPNLSPASPFRVATLDDTYLGRLDSASSTLTADVTSGATSISVTTTTATDLWTTDANEWPFDVIVAGEVMTVTAVAGGSSPQTFTVTRSVNGVTKAQTAGAEVHIRYPAVLAL